MKKLKDIEPIVRKEFSYLVSDFEFEEIASESVPFVYRIKYVKSNLIVSIEYAYRHDYIEPRIYNTNDKINNSDRDKNISIRWILHKKKPGYNYKEYEKLMPKEIGLEASVKEIASLFKEYARDVLLGKEWYSWDEVAGYKYPDENTPRYTKVEIKGQPIRYYRNSQEISEDEYKSNVQ